MEYTKLESEVQALEKRLEVWDASGKHYLGIGPADGIGCRDETIKLQDARIRALEAALAKLDTTAKYLGDCNARNADKANRLEAALRQSRPYVYNAEVADAADLEARYCVLSVIDALLPQTETSAQREGKST